MTEKNPYENGVNIPDFVGGNSKDVDMSVFKLNEAENEMEEEYEDEEPAKKLSAKGIMIIEAGIIAVLLVAAVLGFVSAGSKNKALKAANEELASVQAQLTTANNDVTTLKAQNVALQQQVTDLTKAKEENTTPTADKTMTMAYSVSVRTGNSTKYDFVKFKNLPDDVQENCVEGDDGRVTILQGSKINVYATKDDSQGLNKKWAQIVYNKDVWVCISEDGTAYAN